MFGIQQNQSATRRLTDALDELQDAMGNLSKEWEDLRINTLGSTQEALGQLITKLESKQLVLQKLKPRILEKKSNQSIEMLVQRVLCFVFHIRSLMKPLDTRSRMSYGTLSTAAQSSKATNDPVYVKGIYEAVFARWDHMLRCFDEVYPVRLPTDNAKPDQTWSHGTSGNPIDTSHHQPLPDPPPQTTYYFPWEMSKLYASGFMI
ncbi:hypothetical protein F4813DRAFT_389491 [Daldinia decipiens]|uniref:uncharacterized protein n=1 Tax=Daldinia decipiens TaxID=326647 RepID=UPI0020C20862|nr:uncharacterized protein F4813DRAFT_389491 [Daldinia decipiens]KAI1657752.1 hypothetical protein F4813DRAFT_389491 [Daldinia decipiens]